MTDTNMKARAEFAFRSAKSIKQDLLAEGFRRHIADAVARRMANDYIEAVRYRGREGYRMSALTIERARHLADALN